MTTDEIRSLVMTYPELVDTFKEPEDYVEKDSTQYQVKQARAGYITPDSAFELSQVLGIPAGEIAGVKL